MDTDLMQRISYKLYTYQKNGTDSFLSFSSYDVAVRLGDIKHGWGGIQYEVEEIGL